MNSREERPAPVNVGLLGVGSWGQRLLLSATSIASLSVRWVCDPKLGGASHPTTPRVAHLEELLDDPTCVGLLVATPEDSHASLALQALNAGKFVFVEKPLCTRAGELTALRGHPLAPTHLMVGHLLAYDFAFSALAKVHARRAFSTVHSVRHSLPGARPSRCAWWTLAPHDVSVLLRLWGSPEQVQVEMAAPGAIEARLAFPGGCTAHLSLSTRASHKCRTFVASANGLHFSIESAGEGGVSLTREDVKRALRIPATPPLERELRHFAARIQRGGGFRTGLTSGAEVVEVLLAGQASLQTGKPAVPGARSVDRELVARDLAP